MAWCPSSQTEVRRRKVVRRISVVPETERTLQSLRGIERRQPAWARAGIFQGLLGKKSEISAERIIAVSRLVPSGRWTTYAEVGEIVYGHRRGGQSVGNALREHGHADSAHRVLQTGGKVSPSWRGDGGGSEECIRRLRDEGVWDERRSSARADRFVNADALRRVGA